MKEMSKVKVYIKKSLASILSEKNILSNLHHSLISNLNFSFQDKEYLYLILDYLPGGDLRYYLSKKISFNEVQIKFMISNLILSLNYIHNNNVLHRDIKPENLVFDDKGYLHLTDFGISRKIKNGKSVFDKSGTPGYISPEVLLNKPQNFASDFFSVGVICYELLYNKKPFKGKNKKEMAEKILYKNIRLTKKDIPKNYSLNFGDFINKLLKRNNRDRLGSKGIHQIKNHPWLEGVEWDIIESKLVNSDNIPFSPSIGDNFDNNIANKKEHLDMEHYNEFLKKVNDSGYFKSFYFNYLNIQNSKTVHVKTTLSHKLTSATEAFKTEENYLNNISLSNANNKISGNKINTISNSEDISELNKNRLYSTSNIRKNLKIIIKPNNMLNNKNKFYKKYETNSIIKCNYLNDNNFDNRKDNNNNIDI